MIPGKIKNIVLVGFMGTGKSTIGSLLADDMNWEYVDTDKRIESQAKIPITEIFAQKGEPYFRNLETEVLKKILKQEHRVISTGGGIVLKEENIRLMKENSFIICLTSSPEVIFQRTQSKTTRPILGEKPSLERIQEILAQRQSYYAKADWTIDTSNKSKETTVRAIQSYIELAMGTTK